MAKKRRMELRRGECQNSRFAVNNSFLTYGSRRMLIISKDKALQNVCTHSKPVRFLASTRRLPRDRASRGRSEL
jgi:hypothetical protein